MIQFSLIIIVEYIFNFDYKNLQMKQYNTRKIGRFSCLCSVLVTVYMPTSINQTLYSVCYLQYMHESIQWPLVRILNVIIYRFNTSCEIDTAINYKFFFQIRVTNINKWFRLFKLNRKIKVKICASAICISYFYLTTHKLHLWKTEFEIKQKTYQ
jgi:hypothetical protein